MPLLKESLPENELSEREAELERWRVCPSPVAFFRHLGPAAPEGYT